VGFGEIGRATARLARAFGMRVHALRRRPVDDELVERFYDRGSLGALLATADYVLISAPLTAETQGMIGKRELSQLPRNAVLINLGRGPVVVEEALIEALQSGALRGAVLDVFDVEPLPEGHAFYKLDNVLLSPHCADHTPTWLEDAMNLFVDNYGRFAAGQDLLNVVDKRSGY
jgi:phosphoglycerate dehydrogenase-like enzyme